MKKNTTRLDALRLILANRTASSQKDILDELAIAGFRIQQSTLSKDLQKLHAAKIKTRQGYQYVLPAENLYKRPVAPEALPDFLSNTGFESVSFADNLMILRTRAGYAKGLATEIDQNKLTTVAGTIAGYDTIFIAKAENCDRQQLIDELSDVIPALKSVLL